MVASGEWGVQIMNQVKASVEVYPDSLTLARAATDRWIKLAVGAIQEQGSFSVALAGGSTPRAAYSLLVDARLDWKNIHLFWGDERCVPPDHSDSNYLMARKALLDYVPIPVRNIHRMRGEIPPIQAAAEYEQLLQTFFADRKSTIDIPRSFDLVLLGLGEDGHTASLFPGSPALQVKDRWVAVVEHNQPPPPLVTRLTLTLPILNAAALVMILVVGEGKASRLKQALSPPGTEAILPVQRLQPVNGSVLWLVDQAAASYLQIEEGET
jgi:6-phosphogluconolactonase